MHPSVFDEQKTTVASLADKEVMPCSAFAKEWRFENKANRSFGKTKGATPPRQRAYVHIIREPQKHGHSGVSEWNFLEV